MYFTVDRFISLCMRRVNQCSTGEMFLGATNDQSQLETDLAVNRRSGHGIGAAMILLAILQTVSPATLAQQHNNDFYAPRSATEKQLFDNVQGYHLGPGRDST